MKPEAMPDKNVFARLWERWVQWTEVRASRRSRINAAIYGSGFMVRRWWGFKPVHPRAVYIHSRHQDGSIWVGPA